MHRSRVKNVCAKSSGHVQRTQEPPSSALLPPRVYTLAILQDLHASLAKTLTPPRLTFAISKAHSLVGFNYSAHSTHCSSDLLTLILSFNRFTATLGSTKPISILSLSNHQHVRFFLAFLGSSIQILRFPFLKLKPQILTPRFAQSAAAPTSQLFYLIKQREIVPKPLTTAVQVFFSYEDQTEQNRL